MLNQVSTESRLALVKPTSLYSFKKANYKETNLKAKQSVYVAKRSKRGYQDCQFSMFGIPLKTNLVVSCENGKAV